MSVKISLRDEATLKKKEMIERMHALSRYCVKWGNKTEKESEMQGQGKARVAKLIWNKILLTWNFSKHLNIKYKVLNKKNATNKFISIKL